MEQEARKYLASQKEVPGLKSRDPHAEGVSDANKVLNTIRTVDYPDTPDIGAILRPVDAATIINHCGARMIDLELFEKLISLVSLPDDRVRPFTCAEMTEIQKNIDKADRGEW